MLSAIVGVATFVCQRSVLTFRVSKVGSTGRLWRSAVTRDGVRTTQIRRSLIKSVAHSRRRLHSPAPLVAQGACVPPAPSALPQTFILGTSCLPQRLSRHHFARLPKFRGNVRDYDVRFAKFQEVDVSAWAKQEHRY